MSENKHLTNEVQLIKPPKRLFWHIIERLKIEKHLKIFKEKFLIFLLIFVIAAILAVLAVQALHSEIAESESGPLFLLLFSDTGMVLSYFKYFALAVLESMPVLSITVSLIVVVLLMISLKFVVDYYDKISKLNKLIKTKYGFKNNNTI